MRLADELPESGVNAQHVAFLHLDVIGLHDARQHLVVDRDALVTEMVTQVDQHPASLHAGLGRARDRQVDRAELALSAAAGGIDDRKAVVVDLLGDAVAVGIEQ